MSKLIEKDGKHYRMRRGKLVEIPKDWVGHTTYEQQKRSRPSHKIHKRRKANGWKPKGGPHGRLRPPPEIDEDGSHLVDED